MSRTKVILGTSAAVMAAGAVGYGLGVLFAPASGEETRRRLAWKAEDKFRHAQKAIEPVFERAATRAKAEFDKQRDRIMSRFTCTAA